MNPSSRCPYGVFVSYSLDCCWCAFVAEINTVGQDVAEECWLSMSVVVEINDAMVMQSC